MADSKQFEAVTPEEIFALIDESGAKWIHASKLGLALRSSGKRLTSEQINDLEKKASGVNGGKVTFTDFSAYLVEAAGIEKQTKDMEYAFDILGHDFNDGNVPVRSLKTALTTTGPAEERLTPAEVDQFFNDAALGGPAFESTITKADFLSLVSY